jgi:hypothetical protein
MQQITQGIASKCLILLAKFIDIQRLWLKRWDETADSLQIMFIFL